MQGASNKGFPEALRDLMRDKELSFRTLALATKALEHSLGSAYLNALALETRRPTPANLVTIAKGAGVDPEYFLEYRQHLAATRAAELVGIVGLEAVMRGFDQIAKEAPVLALEERAQQQRTRRGKRDQEAPGRL